MSTSSTSGLPRDWAYSPSIDLELKQYTLLGYLQRVKRRFAERKLYPHLELIHQYVHDLLMLQRTKEDLARSLAGPLVGFETSTGNAIHARPDEPEMLKVIDEVIGFAVPGLQHIQEEGVGLRDEIQRHLHFAPIGLQPLHISEGWLFLRRGREARVYTYSIPFVLEQTAELSHKNVFTRYVTTYTLSLSTTLDNVKSALIAMHPAMPNPATFAVGTDLELPCIETFMPLAKRLVHAHVMGHG